MRRTFAFLAAVLAVDACAVAVHARPALTTDAGKPVAVDPGYCQDPMILDAFDGMTIVAWRRRAMHAVLLDQSGAAGVGWPIGGVRIPQDSLWRVFEPRALRLSDDAVALVWTGVYDENGDDDAYVAWLSRTGVDPPGPAEILIDSVTARAGDQVALAVIRQDDSHAIVALSDKSSGRLQCLIKQAGLPGATSTGWPSGGITLADSIAVFPVSACADDSAGCFVLTMHRHSCSRPPPPTVSPPCPAELRLFHLLPDGEPDPAWPIAGVLVTNTPGWDQQGTVVSDRQGGAYVAWYRSHPDSLIILAQHYGRDGLSMTGWNVDGNQYPPNYLTDLLYLEGVTTSASGELVLLLSNFSQPLLVAVRPDGSLMPGWPATGAFLTGGPNDGSTWRSAQYRMALTPADEIIVVGTRFRPASPEGDDIWGFAFAMSGSSLPGWQPWGSPLCSTVDAQSQPSLTLSANGTFKVAWLDSRDVSPLPDTSPYVFFDHFNVTDGTVPTLATAKLSGHVVEDKLLRATWWLADGGAPDVTALRAVDDGEFSPHGTLERSGEHELTLADSLPANFSRASYVLVRMINGASHSISDTLVIRSRRDTKGLAISCPSPQYGSVLLLELDAATAANAIEVTVFDVAGRRVHEARLKHPGVGANRLTLDLATVRQGLYFVRVSDSDGRRASTQVVRLK